MAGRGPSPQARRVRPNDEARREAEMTSLVDTGELFGPELPEGIEWHPRTVALWDALRRFPTLKDEPALGWEFLLDTAAMHSNMWTNGDFKLAAEIRLRVAKYGATPEDRQRLKVKIEPLTDEEADPAAPADDFTDNVTSISSRRARLAG